MVLTLRSGDRPGLFMPHDWRAIVERLFPWHVEPAAQAGAQSNVVSTAARVYEGGCRRDDAANAEQAMDHGWSPAGERT